MSRSRKLLLSYRAGGSIKEYVHIDAEKPDHLIMETVYDCEPLINHASALSDQVPGKDFRHAAVIPPHVMDQAMREGWLHDKKKWKAWANDGANAKFRTWKGRL